MRMREAPNQFVCASFVKAFPRQVFVLYSIGRKIFRNLTLSSLCYKDIYILPLESSEILCTKPVVNSINEDEMDEQEPSAASCSLLI